MATHSDISYGPAPQIRIIPAPFGISVAMMVGTFFVARYNVNGLREPAGYAPSIMFALFTAVFGFLYWRGCVRITLAESEIRVERLFPTPHQINAIPYGNIAKIKENKLSLKLSLYSPKGGVLLGIPGTVSRLSGEFTVTGDAAAENDPLPPEGLLRERHYLKRELFKRTGARNF